MSGPDGASLMGVSFLFLVFWYHALKTRESVHGQLAVAMSSSLELQRILAAKEKAIKDQDESVFDLEDEDTMFHFRNSLDYVDGIFLHRLSFAFVMVPIWTLVTCSAIMVTLVFVARILEFLSEIRKYSQSKLKFDNASMSLPVELLRFFEMGKEFSENRVYFYVNYFFFHPEILVFLCLVPVLFTTVYVKFILSPLDKLDAHLVHIHTDILFASIMICSVALLFGPLMAFASHKHE